MNKVQQEPRIEAHRTADITDNHQWTRLKFDFAPGQFEQFSSVLQVPAHYTSHIGIGTAASRSFATRWTHTQVPAHLGHQLPGLLHFFPGEVLKILLSQ